MCSDPVRTVVMAALLAACAPRAVRPDDMSAQDHRREADREMTAAREASYRHDDEAGVIVGVAEPGYLYPVTVYNPTEGYLRDAQGHMAHAQEHLDAAAALEAFEEEECREFPPETRSACPLLRGVIAIEDMAGGARLRFAAGAPAAAVAAHMRCHLAYARTRGYQQDEACPLYLPGVTIRLSSDGRCVEITSRDKAVTATIRRLVREQVSPAGGDVS